MKESLALIALFRLTFSSYGQLATITALVGTVSGSSGKAITALDKATLDKYSGITNQDGNYRRRPHMLNADMSIFKSVAITEWAKFTFRAEAFNVCNNPEFSNPTQTSKPLLSPTSRRLQWAQGLSSSAASRRSD